MNLDITAMVKSAMQNSKVDLAATARTAMEKAKAAKPTLSKEARKEARDILLWGEEKDKAALMDGLPAADLKAIAGELEAVAAVLR